MKLTLVAALTLGLYALSPAPINSRPPDFKAVPERNEAQVSEEQKLMRVQGEVGNVPEDTEPNYVDTQPSDPDAAQNVAMAQSVGETIRQADDTVKEDKGSVAKSGFLGLLCLILGACLVLGFRAWANRNVPMPTTYRATKW